MSALVLITHKVGARIPVAGDLSGHDGLVPALLDHLQRVGCEAARGAYACDHQKWMEDESGRSGWRAHLQDDTAHLINVVEEMGIARFEADADEPERVRA